MGLYLLTQSGVSSSPLAFLTGAGGGAVGAAAEGLGEGLGVGTGDFAAAGAGAGSGFISSTAGFSPHAATMANKPSSSMSVVPCCLALLYLDLPQSIPTSR